MSLLSVENLTLLQQQRRRHWFHYELAEKVLIDRVSFAVERFGSLAIVGGEKSGKRALTLALLKLQKVASGKITFADVETTAIGTRHFRRLRKQMQPLFPDLLGQLTPTMTVDEAFQEILQLWYRQEAREQWQHRIETVMVACHLPEAVRDLYPGELDPVERQQVVLARALLSEPKLLIYHRFTYDLDAVARAELINLVREVREDFRLTLYVATDDLAVAYQLSDTIGVLHRGKILEMRKAEDLVSRPEHDYTRRLVAAAV